MGQRGTPLPRLKEHRLRAGMTQAELAQAAGVGMNTVNRLERVPDAHAETRTAKRLAETLGCSVADLMGG